MATTIFTVSEVNRAVKQFLEGTHTFKNIFIQGELSNITYQKSGHLYFTLKDDKASVKCAVFKYLTKGVPTDLKEGEKVKIMGSASLYEVVGNYQIIAESVEKMSGLGSLFEKLEQLKKYYLEKGYFDAEHKKVLPKLPINLGVVTAATGAAIRDIINTTHKRNENANIYLYPAKVQGEGSSLEIANGIEFFNKMKDDEQLNVDILIVGRGGGSIEDLWAFNEEPVIEAIFKSKIPVVSAVGHEIDNLLSDLVADKRAATPTQAAEIIIPEKDKLKIELSQKERILNRFLLNKVSIMKQELEQRKNNYYIKNFNGLLNDKKIKLIDLEEKLTKELKRVVEKNREQLNFRKSSFNKIDLMKGIQTEKENLKEKKVEINKKIEKKILDLKKELEYRKIKISKYSVDDILKQGYALARKNGKIIKRGIELSKGDNLDIQFVDMKKKVIVK